MRQQLADALEQIALELFHAKRLSNRRLTLWQRVLHGETLPEIYATRTVNGSDRTLRREHQRAREIISQFIIEERQGQIRLGVTADTGHVPQWKSDATAQHRKPDQESNWPFDQIEQYAKKGKRW